MPHRIRVGDIMTRNFVFVKPDSTLLETAKTMIKKRVGSIVLKEGNNLHGIITEKDIVWALTKKKGKDLNKIPAKDIATRRIITIKPEDTLDQALDKMNKKKVRRLPVISNKKIIGFLTLKDILRIRPNLYESLEESEKIREESKKIQRSDSAKKGVFTEAQCEECGNFDILESVDGRMICESCKDEM